MANLFNAERIKAEISRLHIRLDRDLADLHRWISAETLRLLKSGNTEDVPLALPGSTWAQLEQLRALVDVTCGANKKVGCYCCCALQRLQGWSRCRLFFLLQSTAAACIVDHPSMRRLKRAVPFHLNHAPAGFKKHCSGADWYEV